jgi:hypothetical protein
VDVVRRSDVRQVRVAMTRAGVVGVQMLIPGVGAEVVELMPNVLDRLAKRMILSGTVRRGPP